MFVKVFLVVVWSVLDREYLYFTDLFLFMISLTETVQQSLANHQPTKPTQEKDKFGEPEEEELERCFKQDVSIVDNG